MPLIENAELARGFGVRRAQGPNDFTAHCGNMQCNDCEHGFSVGAPMSGRVFDCTLRAQNWFSADRVAFDNDSLRDYLVRVYFVHAVQWRCTRAGCECEHCQRLSIVPRLGCECVGCVHLSIRWDEGLYASHCRLCEIQFGEELQAPTQARVFSYSHKPRPKFHHVRAGVVDVRERQHVERGRIVPMFGCEIELELENAFQDKVLALPGVRDSSFWYIKTDGSLRCGLEFVSHPGSIEYWRQVDIDFFARLARMGCKAYNVHTTGMHVHMSKSAISALDRFKLLKFFSCNAEFIRLVSRRAGLRMNRWASVEQPNFRSHFSLKAKGLHGDSSRYLALNFGPAATIECRIFRSTLRVASLKRNIEFLSALLLFVDTASIAQLNAADFCLWLRGPGRYVVGFETARELRAWFRGFRRLPGVVSACA